MKGELLELARRQVSTSLRTFELLPKYNAQLDILAIDFDFVPCQPPFSDALPKSRPQKNPETSPESLDTISKAELRTALQDKEAFYELYIGLTNRAIELYANAGRRKFALRMHGSLAALDVQVHCPPV